MKPGGLRIGTPAMTTRGFTEKDFEKAAEILDRAVHIAKRVNEQTGGKKLLKDFFHTLGEGKEAPELVELRNEVIEFVGGFDLPWSKPKL